MKFKQLLTKSLLVAVCLLAGQSAWGAPTSYLTTWTGTVGTDNSADLYYGTKKVRIAAGESYVYTLKNLNDGGTDTWHNWVVEGNSEGKFFDCCANGDNWPFGNGAPTPSYAPVMATTDVADFMTKYNGATVTITISRNATGNQITVAHTSDVLGTTDGNTDKYYGGTYTMAVGAAEEWDVYITQRYSHFVVTNVTYTDAESNVTNYNPLYERGYTTAWSAGDIADGKWVQTNSNGTASINATKGLYIASTKDGSHNKSYEITNSSQISPSANSTIFIDAIWNIGAAYGTDNYNYLKIGSDIEIKCSGQNQNGYVVLNGVSNAITDACQKNYKRDNDIWNIHIEINTATNTVANLTINGLSAKYGNTTKQANISLSNKSLSGSATYNTIAMGNTQASKNYSQDMGLVSFMVSEKPSDVTYANYTVHFKDNNGATVKVDDVRLGEVGATVNANSDDKAIYYGGGNKYTYKSDGEGVEVVADGTAELTVVYDKHEAFTVTASAVSGGSTIQTDIASVSGYEGETKTLQLHKYIKVGETWYSTATCYVDVTEGGDNEVTYTPTAVKYFYEFESLSGGSTDETDKTYSGGIRSRVSRSNSLSTPEEIAGGVYTLTIPYSNSNSTAGKLYLYTVKGGVETDTELTIDCPSGNGTVKKTVTIPDGAALRFKNTNSEYNDNGRIDYLILTPRVTKTISTAGWATFCSPYALDLKNAEGLDDAYIVTGGQNGVLTKNSVMNGTVPANTGLLLKGNEGTATIPVVANSETNVENNILKGVTAETTIDAGTGWVLMNDATNGLGFYKNNKDFTVGANTAYILISKLPELTGGARASYLLFSDDVTGISQVAGSEVKTSGAVYNLNGQRVSQPVKGLYIIDGKKVVIK